MTDNEIYEAYECCIIEKRQKKEQKELAKARRGTWFGGDLQPSSGTEMRNESRLAVRNVVTV